MKKLFLFTVAAFALVAVLALVGCSSSTPAATSSTAPSSSSPGSSSSSAGTAVTIANFAFSPADLTVKVGDTVTWTNNDSVTHTVTGSGWDAGRVAPAASVSHKFGTAGSYPYHCSIHPSMTGKITVQ